MSHHITHPNLTRYVEGMNLWAKLGQGTVIEIRNLTRADKAKIAENLEGDFSPENLCCDGELSGAALKRKVAYLNAVKAELETM